MATKPDAAKQNAEEPVRAAPKSKKMLLVGGIVVLILALTGGGAWFVLSKIKHADEDTEVVVKEVPKGPPTFFPLESMVVNLADPGGEKVAQIGITLELADAKTSETIKMYLPSIRSSILLLISQRTSEELLQIEGKEKLAADIVREASQPFGLPEKSASSSKSKKKNADKNAVDANPVRGVLFSSFIVQ